MICGPRFVVCDKCRMATTEKGRRKVPDPGIIKITSDNGPKRTMMKPEMFYKMIP